MAFKILLIVIVATSILAPTFATDYTVGDIAGWKLGVDYSTWAEGKQFYVGDKLIFKYGEGAHNVYKVNGTTFEQCMVQSEQGPLTSGNDVITLTTPGRKWYICGIGSHCTMGMKLVITVSSMEAPAPAPISASNRNSHAIKTWVWTLAALIAMLMISA